MAGTASVYVVEKPLPIWEAWLGRPTFELRDANGRDGEWHAIITLPHEVVAWDGLGVPAFGGDVERREWEAAH